MTWRANERALLEFGRLLAAPHARQLMKSYELDKRPVLCVDKDDLAIDVVTEATIRGTASIIAIRTDVRAFRILSQVYGAEQVPVKLADEMTIGEFEARLREAKEPSNFANAGDLVDA